MRLFVDTVFVIALINARDQHHVKAVELAKQYDGVGMVITDAVLLEIGNALSRGFKLEAVEVIQEFLASPDVEIIRTTADQFNQAFDLYRSHIDKEWGLVDCLSFIAMREAHITSALSFDQHFVQAGFQALMR